MAGTTQPPEAVNSANAACALVVLSVGEVAPLPEGQAGGVVVSAVLWVNEVQDLFAAGPEETGELL